MLLLSVVRSPLPLPPPLVRALARLLLQLPRFFPASTGLFLFFFFSYLSKCDFIRVAVIQWPVQLLPVVISALPLPLSLVRALRQALLQLLPCVPANYHFVLLAVATVGKRYQRKTGKCCANPTSSILLLFWLWVTIRSSDNQNFFAIKLISL